MKITPHKGFLNSRAHLINIRAASRSSVKRAISTPNYSVRLFMRWDDCIWDRSSFPSRNTAYVELYDPRRNAVCACSCDRCFADPQTGVAPGVTRGRNMRSRYRCSMCPAIHINSRTWLRSSSTHEPSDPPLRVISSRFFFILALDSESRSP